MTTVQTWVKYDKVAENRGNFVIAPLNRGMGNTIGNSLRRVLLSSLGGHAISAIRIDGVEHEYSTIPNVVEDTLDIIANLKGIVFKADQCDEKELKIRFSGQGVVTAKDIITDSSITIINPELPIAQVSSNGKLTVDLKVKYGVGYCTVEQNKDDNQDIHTINIDSSYSPIIRVNHAVENVRIGKELGYDSLKLEVVTNGSITPDDAVKQAANILIEQFAFFSSMNEKPKDEHFPPAIISTPSSTTALSLSIDDLELSARSSNCFKRAGVETVGQLVSKELSELIQIKNFGKKSADEINEKLKQYSLSLRGSENVIDVSDDDDEE